MERFYDPQHNRLIYVDRNPTPDFWDERWLADGGLGAALARTAPTHVSRLNRRYVDPEAGPVLEGGCGTAKHLAAMVRDGYECVGIDNAEQTVAAVKEAAPELDVRLGDVRELDLPDASFAAYWSLGVIEHFPEGYEAIGREMARVLKPGGVLLLAFPRLSPLRRRRALSGAFPTWSGPGVPEGFYQFALDHERVAADFQTWGFRLEEVRPQGGLYGFGQESPRLGPAALKLSRYRGGFRLVRGARRLLSDALDRDAGHSILLVLRRA
ncbi:MAG: class I SAM-dependent methyltransferase [bacterium]|nr:class I SAM-dependent methyltransferase [bacterium]